MKAELDAGIETERDFKYARSSGTTPNGNAREFQNADWRNPVTPNQMVSTEISLEMNEETKNKIKNETENMRKGSRRRPETDRDNRLAEKTHLHIIVFEYLHL